MNLKKKLDNEKGLCLEPEEFIEQRDRIKSDVKESVNDFLFLIDYDFIFDENSSYEEQAKREYFDLCSKYNLKYYEEYSKEELSLAVFGDLEEENI